MLRHIGWDKSHVFGSSLIIIITIDELNYNYMHKMF